MAAITMSPTYIDFSFTPAWVAEFTTAFRGAPAVLSYLDDGPGNVSFSYGGIHDEGRINTDLDTSGDDFPDTSSRLH